MTYLRAGRKRIPLGVVSTSFVRNGKHDCILLTCFRYSPLILYFLGLSAQRRRSSQYALSPSRDMQTSPNEPSVTHENMDQNRAPGITREIGT